MTRWTPARGHRMGFAILVAGLIVSGAAIPAMADGGAGGSVSAPGSGGPGGTGFTGNPGGNPTSSASGGGGGGAGGGDGGSGIGGGAGSGGTGGTSPAGNGGTGGNGSSLAAGAGGGGGGGNGNGAGAPTISNASPLLGGSGGTGGVGLGGGGGGAGGYGAIVTGAGASSNTSSITGGAGGAGGTTTAVSIFGDVTVGGNGGDGGVGAQFTTSGASLNNSGTISGGAGGAGGVANGGGTNGTAGAGGAGIVGSGLTITNSGSINGGLGGDGTTLANAITFTGGSNTLTLQPGSSLLGNIANGGTSLTFNQSAAATVPNAITGSGIVIQAGSSVLTLTGANTYTGGTSITAGTLAVGNSSALGTGTLTPSNGTTLEAANNGLVLSNAIALPAGDTTINTQGNTLTLSGALSGAGAGLTKLGTGTLTLSNANTFGGGGANIDLSAGTLAVGNNLALGGDILTILDGTTLQAAAANLTLANSILLGVATIDSQANSLTLTGVIAGDSLAKIGTGTLTLTNTNTYVGATTINAGTLALSGGTASIAASSSVNLAAGGVIFDISGAGNQSVLGLTGVVGSFVDLGSKTLTVNLTSGANTFNGIIQDGGTAGGIGGSLVKSGGGTLLLTQANTYTGSTTVSGGILALTGVGSVASSTGVALTSASAKLDISDSFAGTTVQGLTGVVGSRVSLGNQALTVAVTGAPNTFNGVLQDGGIGGGTGGSLVKSGGGTLLLTQPNTYAGPTTIAAGSLALTGTGSIATSSGVSLTAAGANLDISFTTAGVTVQSLSGVAGSTISLGAQPLTVNVVTGSSTFAGAVADGGIGGGIGGSLIKSGAGTLILDGSNTYTGGTTVNAGTLEVGDVNTPGATLGGNVAVNAGGTLMGHGTLSGNVVNGGTVQPGGSIGVMTVAGNYTQSSAGTLSIEITPNVAAGPGVGYDQLRVGGTASLAGTLSIIDDPGTYAVGSLYTILTATGGRSGTFATVTYNPLFAGYITPVVSYDANDVFLTLDPTPGSTPSAPPPLFAGGQQVPDMLTAMVSAVQGVGDTVLGDVCGPTAQRLVTQGEGCVVRPLAAGYRAEVWMRGFGGVGSLDGSGSRLSFNNSYAGTLIGAGIGQGGFTVGFGGGYLRSALNFSDGSNASQNAGLGFVYGRYAQGPMWFGAMAAYGGGTVSGSRTLPGTGLTASGNRGGDFGIVEAQAAYDIPVGAMTFEPRASLSYIHAGQNGFGESGASILDLSYANTNADVFEGRLVGRVMQRFVAGTWSLVPYVEAGVQETFTGLSRGVTMTDGAFAGSAAGVSPAPTAGVVGVGVSAGMTERLDLFIAYQGQYSANQAESTFAAGLVYRL